MLGRNSSPLAILHRLGVLSGLIGATVFAGWIFGITPLHDVTGVVTMKTNMALATCWLGSPPVVYFIDVDYP